MHRRVDPHRRLVRVLAGDLGVHVEEVAVLGLDRLAAQPGDRVGEVEVDAEPARARRRGPRRRRSWRPGTRCHAAPGCRTPGRSAPGSSRGPASGISGAGRLSSPDFGTQMRPSLRSDSLIKRQLGLVLTRHRDAGGVDLGVAGIGEVGTLAVRPPGGGDVAAHRVGGQVEHVAVATGGEHHGVGVVGLDLTGHHVPDDHAAGLAVGHDQLEHLVPGVHLHRAGGDLPLQGLVGADQQLLAGLAAGVEGAGHLHAAEGAVVEQAAVLPGERHALGHALVDDLHAGLGQPVDVGLPGAEVAALDRVVEQPVDRVAVVAVVLGRVDAALGGDRVRPPRGVLVAEAGDLVAGLAERRGRRGAGQAGADDDHRELAAVGRVDQLGVEPPLVPALLDRDRPGALVSAMSSPST